MNWDEDKKALSSEGIAALTAQMKPLHKELKLCQEIEARSTMLPERLAEIRQTEQEKQFKRIAKAQNRRYDTLSR